MPLENRVLPNGAIVAQDWRGCFMGNRGGRIHDPETKGLLKRRWHSKSWIICVTEFKQRHREVMGHGYTELFFFDEVTALAAGHRPCFECRRKDAERFAKCWYKNASTLPKSRAKDMDARLHPERLSKPALITQRELSALPPGVMVQAGERFFAKHSSGLLEWCSTGYRPGVPQTEPVLLLTPPSMVQVLANGFEPVWHPSAEHREGMPYGRA